MSPMRPLAVLLLLFLVPLLVVTGIPAQDPVPDEPETPPADESPVGPEETLQFQQQRALAHMRELEERMFRLSELIRDAEPDHAARLVLGLQKAREELIAEDMREIVTLIEKGEIGEATERQQEVVAKLEALKALLLSTDLDLLLKLDRLRKLTQAIEQLEKVVQEEKREQNQSDQLADQQAKSESLSAAEQKELEEALERLKRAQEENRRANDAVREDVREIATSDMKSPSLLEQASGSMSGAESSLGEGQPSSASSQQQKAVEDLEEALAELEKERQELLQQLQNEIRGQVIEALQTLLERQRKIREGTEAVAQLPASQKDRIQARLGPLADDERELAQLTAQTIELIEETEFSVALPYALGDIRRQMLSVQNSLARGRCNSEVVSAEKQIEADLEELLQTLEDEQKGAAAAGDPQQGGCQECANKNKLLSELKVIRMLQMRVNERTLETDDDRPEPPAELSRDLKAAILGVRDKEDHVRGITDRLHKRSCAECAKGLGN